MKIHKPATPKRQNITIEFTPEEADILFTIGAKSSGNHEFPMTLYQGLRDHGYTYTSKVLVDNFRCEVWK